MPFLLFVFIVFIDVLITMVSALALILLPRGAREGFITDFCFWIDNGHRGQAAAIIA